jgi:spore germination cell wall hydrolase CwlJ-like protein
MLFGEARNCSEEEKIAIAYTAINRASDGKKWNGSTVKESILVPYQYSCFNINDPNRKKLMNPEIYDIKSFRECLVVAGDVLNRKYKDPTQGATHYHVSGINPSWSKSSSMTKTKEGKNFRHTFYREK